MAETGRIDDEELVRRLRSVQGHVRGVERMITEGEYCVDVLHQISAVQRALARVGDRVLERHLHTCAAAAIRGDDPGERERVVGEILEVVQQSRKR